MIRDGNHFEELLVKTFTTTSHTFSAFSSQVFQFRPAHHRAVGVERRAQSIHGCSCAPTLFDPLVERERCEVRAFESNKLRLNKTAAPPVSPPLD